MDKPKFYCGATCKHHPDDEGLRYVSTGHCVQCAKDRTAAWQEKRRKHAEEIAQRSYQKVA